MKRSILVMAVVLGGLVVVEAASAQPILNRVEQFIRDQIDNGRPVPQGARPANEQGYMGLVADDSQEQGRGVRIVELTPGSPAAAAGVQKGDLITVIAGQRIGTMDDLARTVQGKPPGTRLTISLLRGNDERQLDVTLGRRGQAAARPAEDVAPGVPASAVEAAETPPAGPRLGVRTVPVSEEVQQQNNLPDTKGAVVVNVSAGSPAEAAGLPTSAVILAVDGKPVATPQELAEAIRTSQAAEVELTYVYQGEASRKKVAVAAAPATPAANEPAKLELRGRPVAAPPGVTPPAPRPPVALPAPSDEGPAIAPTTEAADRASLEERIRQLEARIEKLEAALARTQRDTPNE